MQLPSFLSQEFETWIKTTSRLQTTRRACIDQHSARALGLNLLEGAVGLDYVH